MHHHHRRIQDLWAYQPGPLILRMRAIGAAPDVPGFTSIVVMCGNTFVTYFIASSRFGLLLSTCLPLTCLLFLRVLKHGTYLFLLFSPLSIDPPLHSVSSYHIHADRHVTCGHHSCLRLCFIGWRFDVGLGGLGCDWVIFGSGRGIVRWLRGSGGWEQVSRRVVASICCWHHRGCAKSGLGDFEQDRWGCTKPFDVKMFA